MGFYRSQIVPRVIDKACGGPDLKPLRDRTCDGLSGVVVELGFGSGLNIASYPGSITLLHAIEPSAVGRSLGAERIAASKTPIEFSGLRGESLPLDDDSCDGALCTFTLCTIGDVDAALQELLRVLRPGAPFHFLEHGSAPDPKVRSWQRRLIEAPVVLRWRPSSSSSRQARCTTPPANCTIARSRRTMN